VPNRRGAGEAFIQSSRGPDRITSAMSEESFDAVIIGSGFGGAVMAYRMSEAGLKVLVLERGKSYPPNSFARGPREIAENFWDPSQGRYGLFNMWSFRKSGAIISSGLGGGSLVYANVLIRKPEKWFVYEDPAGGGYRPWAVTRAELDPHYDRAEKMLGAQIYPGNAPGYKDTPKMVAFDQAAISIGRPAEAVKLAVSFHSKAGPEGPDNPPVIGGPIYEPFPNLHGMPRSTCHLCGECDIGCNSGSKNTLDFNYLSAAVRLGAEVRTLCEVKEMSPRAGGGYEVRYLLHEPQKYDGKHHDTNDRSLFRTVKSKYLVLAAGTLGSAYLMLKNRSAFPGVSAQLGNRYSTNGDMLSIVANATMLKDGKRVPRNLRPYFGAAITRGILCDADKPNGFLIEEWGNPYLISWAVGLSGLGGFVKRFLRFIWLDLIFQLGFGLKADISGQISALFVDNVAASTSLPLIAMGQEPPAGTFSLKDGQYLDLDWNESKEFYTRLGDRMRAVAEAFGGQYKDNPLFRFNFKQFLSAHPLGGCSMGSSIEEGVVSSTGEVFNYPGFYIADGSVMPGPVGVNPALTIAACADRFADSLIRNSAASRG
jgi:cholesterol oxidase